MAAAVPNSLLLALCLAGVGGCYTTVPLASEPPRPDREVVLEFTDEGAQSLGGLLGRAVVSARGKPLAWTSDTVALAMVATTNARGGEQFWRGERVAIPRQFVLRTRERALDRRRTALAVIGGVAVAALVQQVTGRNAGAPPLRDPVGPTDNRAP
ncbi:MAG TPA: hypothetical protein VFZ56_07780 [Gemmatimonadaceae bacterium]